MSEANQVIEVGQTELKQALKGLLTAKEQLLSELYKKHEEYNETFFESKLSIPLITIDKLSNKTLADYREGRNNMEIENHIRFNANFVALNPIKRILETLKHEMIHQWQDEVAYKGLDNRPKNWHNALFRNKAEELGIPANGKKCTGNPSKMPEPKSYNKKFRCGCIASNGAPVTIWSTRAINATCNICGLEYTEVSKRGIVIPITKSFVEEPGQDLIKEKALNDYNEFWQFKTPEEAKTFVKENDARFAKMLLGKYPQGTNGYKAGFTCWVAFTLNAEIVTPVASGTGPKQRGRKKRGA
jgi:hypothetical protein